MTIQITEYDPQGEDFGRVGDKLTAYTEKIFAEAGEKPPQYTPISIAFRAAVAGKTVAELLATLIWESDMEVQLLHVEKDFRDQGLGTALMQAVEEKSRKMGATGIKLWTPTFQGDGFYQRLGYEEVAKLPLNKTFHGEPQFHHLFYKPLTQG